MKDLQIHKNLTKKVAQATIQMKLSSNSVEQEQECSNETSRNLKKVH
jgi:hypothetical protein